MKQFKSGRIRSCESVIRGLVHYRDLIQKRLQEQEQQQQSSLFETIHEVPPSTSQEVHEWLRGDEAEAISTRRRAAERALVNGVKRHRGVPFKAL